MNGYRKKNKVSFSTYLDIDTWAMLKAFAQTTGKSRIDIVNVAINDYIGKQVECERLNEKLIKDLVETFKTLEYERLQGD